jgi:hypothetical protein
MPQQTRGARSIIAGAKDDAIDRGEPGERPSTWAGLQCRVERDLSLITGPKVQEEPLGELPSQRACLG